MNRLKTYQVEVCYQQWQFIKVNGQSAEEAKAMVESNNFDPSDASELIPEEPRIMAAKEVKES